MSPPTTVTGYYTEANSIATAAVTSTQQALTQANSDLANAQSALTAATGQLAADQAQNATLRTELAAAALPSDASLLLSELQQNMIQIRIDESAVGAATDAVTAATADQQSASANAGSAQQTASNAAAALAASVASDAKVAQWQAILASGPVTAAFTEVAAPTVSTMVTNATNQLETIIGTGMTTLFTQRRDDYLASITALETSLGNAQSAQNALMTTDDPLHAAVTKAAAAYQADLALLQQLATESVGDITGALNTLTSAASVGALPSSEQTPLTAATAAASAEIAAEQAVYSARSALRGAEATLDTFALTQYQSNPDFDPETDPSASADRTAISTDQTTLSTAQSTLATGQSAVDNWEVQIPESVMQLVVGVVEAESTVAFYTTNTPSSVNTQLATDQATYAAALDALLTYERSSSLLADQVASRQAALSAAQQVQSARENAAIRGAL